jgi:hypothetical protein
LSIQNGELVVANAPVPRGSFFSRWLAVNGHFLEDLRMVKLPNDILRKFFLKKPPSGEDNALTLRRHQILARILESLAATNKRKNSALVIVYLPVRGEVWAPESSQPLRILLSEEAGAQNIPYFDLTTEFSRLHANEIERLYISESVTDYNHAVGHYSVAGNEIVTRTLYHLLLSQPSIAEKLSASRPQAAGTPPAAVH